MATARQVYRISLPQIPSIVDPPSCLQWARTNPPPKMAGYHNPGWPGCCRPPAQTENRLIGAADWPAVSLVHHVPIPPDVKAILESLTSTSRLSPPGGYSSATVRTSSTQSSAPSMPRRGSYNVTTAFNRSETTPTRTPPLSIPPKSRSNGSPKQVTSSLTANVLKDSGEILSSSLPITSAIDQYIPPRRSIDTGDKRPDFSNELRYSPNQKNIDLGVTLTRKGSGSIPVSGRRGSVSVAAPSLPLTKTTADAQQQRRRVGAAPNPQTPSPPSTKSGERQNLGTPSRRSLENSMASMKISSASSDSSGSASEMTADGGFTDYLSDESEAELQRQAEIKAALIAQNVMEEEEFKAARRKLANVDLRPPQSWTGTMNRS